MSDIPSGIDQPSDSADPRVRLAESPMTAFQVRAIVITAVLNALDGFDILAVTFAAPGIAAQWNIGAGLLGIIISASFAGMAVGSLVLASLADVAGRRPVVIGCLTVMIGSMFMSAASTSPMMLGISRFITGVAVGTIIPSINALSSEYANRRRREVAVGLMTIGYPVGGITGGLAANWLLNSYDWRSIFIFGGVLSLLMLPLVLAALPESMGFLLERRPTGALKRINALLLRMGHPVIRALPPAGARVHSRLKLLFGPELRSRTLLLSATFFLHTMTTYFYLGWLPQLVTAYGFSPRDGALTSAVASACGLLGNIIVSVLAFRVGAKPLTVIALGGAGLAVMFFPSIPGVLPALQFGAGVAGLFIFAGNCSLYILLAMSFPTAVRASGTGIAIGFGRIGAAVGPALAGYMLEAGFSRALVGPAVGCASLFGAALLLLAITRGSPSATNRALAQ